MSDGNDTTTNTADPVELLVGEGKKYKTVADLAKSRLEADNYIKQIESENAAMRSVIKAKDETSRAEDFDDFIAGLKKKPTAEEPKPPNTNNQSVTGMTLSDVEVMLEKREMLRKAEASFATVKETLAKTYGDKTDEVLTKAMADAGMTMDDVRNLATKSPAVALRALGLATSQGTPSMTGSVSTEALFGTTQTTRNYAHYKALRTKIGDAAFYDKKVQQQLFKDRMAQGESFFAT